MPAAIVLAAGRATRFGGDKLIALVAGRTIIQRTVDAVRQSAVGAILVVVADDSSGNAVQAALASLAVTIVPNADAAQGLSTSVRAGVAALPADTDAVVIALGDQPGVDPAVIDRLIAHWRATDAAIVAPMYQDGRGNPVLFDARVFPELRALQGDEGARALMAHDRARVALIAVSGAAPRDIDTHDDLRALNEHG